MAEPEQTTPVSERRELVEAVVASTIGTTIEWYDFFLYGMAAATVFPDLFFPRYDPFVAQILSLGTFSIGFVARPLGGLLFGYLGDRVGRKSTLVATLLLMGVSTVLIGLLPTYGQIGVTAAILLTLLRFMQGLGVGGEWGGAVLLALEYGHRGKRGFYASWPQTGVPLGMLLATGAMGGMQALLSREDFLSWGWRVPFLCSGVLILVGFVIRARIHETPLFRRLQETGQVSRTPIRDTLRLHWREVILAAGARVGENACFYLFTIYLVVYVRDILKLPEGVALFAVALAAALEFFLIPVFGLLSDFWSRKGMFMVGCFALMLFAFPYYALLETRQPALVVLAVVISVLGCHAILYSVAASLIPELFETRVRYTGASLGYQLSAPLGGGLAPLIAAWLVQTYPGQSWPLALYVVLLGGISLVSVWLLAETSRKSLET